MTTNIGLRQRKRDQTKQALKEAAYRLFEDRGYDKASIDDIAREANYAPRTFFLHFASKEDLLFPDESMLVHSLQTALNERAEGVTALQTLRFWAKTVVFQKEAGNTPGNILRRKIIDADKSLQARQRLNLNEIENILAITIANDLGGQKSQMRSRITAAAAIAVFGMLDELIGYDHQSKRAQGSIDMAIDFLESGLGGLNPEKRV